MTTDEFRALQGVMRRWGTQRRRLEFLTLLPRLLAISLFAGLLAGIISRLRPLMTREELVYFAVTMVSIAVATAILIYLFRRHSLANLARFADRKFNLRERVLTAVEIQSGQLTVSDDLAAKQLNDALGAARAVDLERQMPLRFQLLDWLPSLVIAVLLVIVLWLPNPQEAILLEQRALVAAIEKHTQTLESLAQEIESNDSLTAEQKEALQKPLEEALTALQKPDITREEAVAALSQAESELRSLGQNLDSESMREALTESADSLENPGAAADLIDALQNGQLSAASSATVALAENLAGLSVEEQATLAEALSTLAAGARDADPTLAEDLERASKALSENDIAAAQDALDDAASTLAERAESLAAASQASGAADQLSAARGEIAQGGAGDQPGENGSVTDTGQDGGTSGDGSGESVGQQGSMGGTSEGGGHVENVFIPNPTNIDAEGENLELDTECLSDPESCGPFGSQSPSQPGEQVPGGSLVPYDQVFGDYRDAAIEALNRGNIPVNLQSIIREYFLALEP